MSELRVPGECAGCTRPLYAVEQRLSADHSTHPRYPVRLGELIERDAETFHVLLADGKRADVTLCAKCAGKSDDAAFWRATWARCMRLMSVRHPLAKPLNPDAEAAARRDMAKLANNPPIGVLGRRLERDRRGRRTAI